MDAELFLDSGRERDDDHRDSPSLPCPAACSLGQPVRSYLMLPVTERPYEPSDLASIIELFTASIRCLAAPFYTPEQLAAWAPATPVRARWRQHLESQHAIVADGGSSLAGFASYQQNGSLDLLYTHPAFARCGIATRFYVRTMSAPTRADKATPPMNPKRNNPVALIAKWASGLILRSATPHLPGPG